MNLTMMAHRVLGGGKGEREKKSRQNPKWLLHKTGRQRERSDRCLWRLRWPAVNAPGREMELFVI